MATIIVQTFFKQPGEELDYKVDWTAWLESGDTIAESAWDVPDGLTQVGDPTNTTTTATIVLSGGTVDTHYEVVNTITTANGLVAIRTLDIRIIATP